MTLSFPVPLALRQTLSMIQTDTVDDSNREKTVNPEIFARFLFSRIALKDSFCDAKSSRLGHDLHKPVNDRVISTFKEDFIFMKLRENKTLAISEFTVDHSTM